MEYVLLNLSVFSTVLNNSLVNRFSKKYMTSSKSAAYSFNFICYLVSCAIFGALAVGSGISLYTAGLGIVFGIVTLLSNLFRMLALAKGAMHITVLITTSSMIIPALSGVLLFGETFSSAKLVVIFFLLLFIYLSAKQSGKVRFDGSWLILCILAFIFQGTIGVLQKVHQNSAHKGELSAFLAVAFLVSLIFSFVMSKSGKKGEKLPFAWHDYVVMAVSGLCVFTMNYLNLKLSGLLPSQLFFPIVNGSSIVISSLVSLFLFKEKLTKRQTAGLVGGIVSLILICIL